MLAHPVKGIDEIFKRITQDNMTAEYKLDGERCQVILDLNPNLYIHVLKTSNKIHLENNDSVTIFSRNGENSTEKFPDLIPVIQKIKNNSSGKVRNFILDAEVVAYDTENEIILPFQVLSTRKRKDVENSKISVDLFLYAFDMIYFNDESLVSESLSERRKKLNDILTHADKKKISIVTSKDCLSSTEIQDFFEQSIV